jgi:ESCRT-II complex subunit VPS25
LTFYEITSPELDSELKGLPLPLLRKVIAILGKTGRAQIIEGDEGGGVRFFVG